MKLSQRLASVAALATVPIAFSALTAPAAHADPYDAASYVAHLPGTMYDMCTGPGVGYLPGPVVCALYATSIPSNTVYELNH